MKKGEKGLYELIMDKSENIDKQTPNESPFRMVIDDTFLVEDGGPVIAGMVESGVLQVGDEIEIIPSNGSCRQAIIKGINHFNKKLDKATFDNYPYSLGISLEGFNCDYVKELINNGNWVNQGDLICEIGTSPVEIKPEGTDDLESLFSDYNPDDSSHRFIEGVLAYARRSDKLALEHFRACMDIKPLCAEAPYYIGQILTESAINDYKKANSGNYTAEMVLRWANTYDESMSAFALAKYISNTFRLNSISKHLRTYELLLGFDSFRNSAKIQSQISSIDDRYTTPDKWLSLIGLPYDEHNIYRDCREAIVDLICNLASQQTVVYVTGDHDTLNPVSMLLSRRMQKKVFEVGATMSDEMLELRLSSIKAGSVVLTDPRRIGFGEFFSWAPLNAETVEVVFLNPQYLLTVELFGILARMGFDKSKTPKAKFTFVSEPS